MELSTLLERSYSHNCRKIFNNFLKNNLVSSDVKLMGDDGTCVKCHTFVLSACSPFFEKAFANCAKGKDISGVDNTELVVLLATYKSTNVQRMVDYIYFGKITEAGDKVGIQHYYLSYLVLLTWCVY